MASTSKPAVVVAIGAWHTPAHWADLASHLEAAGYQVGLPKLHGVSGTPAEDGLHRDAAIFKEAIEAFTSKGTNVVVLAHSYGGNLASEAVAEFQLDSKNSQPGQGRIVRLVYIAATLIAKGSSHVGEVKTNHTLSLEDGGLLYHMEPFARFYHRVDLPIARKAINQLSTHDLSCFTNTTKHTGWKDFDLPVTYVVCSQDQALHENTDQSTWVARLKEAGLSDLEILAIDTDHSPWLSRKEEFLELLSKVLQKAETGVSKI